MATFKYYDGTKYNRITGGLVPKTTKTTSDTETYSCNYVNANTIPVINFSGDFNDYKETAVGQCQMSANKPPTGANYFYGTLIVIKFESTYCSQLTTDINTGEMYNRVLVNGTWTAWKRVQQTEV